MSTGFGLNLNSSFISVTAINLSNFKIGWILKWGKTCFHGGRLPMGNFYNFRTILFSTWNWSEREIRSVVSDSATPWTVARQALCPWNFPRKNTGVSSRSILQGIYPTQGSNPGLLHCRQILYHLSHQGKPKNTGVSLSLLQEIFLTQGRIMVSCIAGRFFTSWATREAPWFEPRTPLKCTLFLKWVKLYLQYKVDDC